MAISCEPADLASAAKCYACLGDEERDAVKIYLLAVIAGLDGTSTTDLVAAAKCYGCIPPPVRAAVEAYLLCQAANSGAAPAECAMLTGDGDPTGVETPEFDGQLYHDTTGDTWWYSTGTTSADWTEIPTGGGPCENVEGAGDPT